MCVRFMRDDEYLKHHKLIINNINIKQQTQLQLHDDIIYSIKCIIKRFNINNNYNYTRKILKFLIKCYKI